jgi:sugar (pentulose or hexulose) kinase
MSLKNKILLADFGASRIKSIVVDKITKNVIDAREEISPSQTPDILELDSYQISFDRYHSAFSNTVLKLLQVHTDIDSIYICSEMHGFSLLDLETNKILPYVSWKDNSVKIDPYLKYSNQFFNLTGIKLRPGLPFLSIKNKVDSNKKYKFCTLVDALLYSMQCQDIRSDFSLATSSGLIDLRKKEWSQELCPYNNISFNEISFDPVQPIATFNGIKIFGGIGDLQAAVLGSGLNQHAVINLGTGSQVICKDNREGFEVRPYLNNYIRVITHIPCGRALNLFAGFISNFSSDKNLFWSKWDELTAYDVLNSENCVDLNVFDAAWKFSSSSGYIRLREEKTDLEFIIGCIARSWATQYIEAIGILDPNKEQKEVIVSGGVANKSKFLLDVLRNLDPNRNYQSSGARFKEETFDGLYNLHLLGNTK